MTTPNCRRCRRSFPASLEHVRAGMGEAAQLPQVQALLASGTDFHFCRLRREHVAGDVTCEHGAGALDGLRRLFVTRVLGRPDPDAILASQVVEEQRAAALARAEGVTKAARAVPEIAACPDCGREHSRCSVCRIRRDYCGECPKCAEKGLSGRLWLSRLPVGFDVLCARCKYQATVSEPPALPVHRDGVCDGCRGASASV